MSYENAENVVNDPNKPTIKNALNSELISPKDTKYVTTNPIKNDPITFTPNVPIG